MPPARVTPVISVRDVSKTYRRYMKRHQSLKEIIAQRSLGEWEDFWALRDISFDVQHGDFLGVVGHNGSGKSTLLKLLTGIMPPTRGEISVEGRVTSLLELGAGFQPEYTGRENVYLYGTLLGMRRKEIERYYESIVDFCELGDFMETAVKNYSSGMYVRLGFAVAVQLEPEILLIDEVLAVGDANFQKKCFEHLFKLREAGCTIVLVTHDTNSVERFCEQAIWIDHGRLMAQGTSTRITQEYLDAVEMGASVRQYAPTEEERHADRDLRILGIRHFNATGSQVTLFDTGSPVRMVIDFEAARPMSRLEVGVAIYRHDGTRCLDAQLYGVEAAAGRGRWLLDIHKMNLQSGHYDVSISVFDRNRKRYQDLHEHLYPFGIHDEFATGGVAWADHSWSAEKPDGTVVPLKSKPPSLDELHGIA